MSSTVVRAPRRGVHAPAAVTVHGVSKRFKIPHRQHHTLKERVLHPREGKGFDVLRAVNDVSVDIEQGEFFGIIGRNGSGKSTLLKCIAGIYRVDEGHINVLGRLSPFIELGVGFNMELTARDNVMINAIMLGLSRKEARERFGRIIDFAELHDFLDLKLKNYSSGMLVRLAFSVAIQVYAEVLLIDEVLAVGDANFQQKCFDEFERMKREGRTIVFVTHDMSAIERFCDRAMLLDKGNMVEIGEPTSIARKYNRLNFGQTIHELDNERNEAEYRAAEILDAWFEDASGARAAEMAYGDHCCVAIEARFNEDIDEPIFGATLRNDVGATVFSTSTMHSNFSTGHFSRGETTVVRLRFDNWMTMSRYTISPSIARHGLGADVIDLREDLATLVVHSGHFTGGVVELPHQFEVERR